jgi:hypothetical protein
MSFEDSLLMGGCGIAMSGAGSNKPFTETNIQLTFCSRYYDNIKDRMTRTGRPPVQECGAS